VRNVVFMMSVSLDGYMEGPDGDIGWHLVDEELHRHFNEVLASAGAFLEGRVTHELMAGYWPTADADPSSSPAEVAYARIWRDMPKLVFSRTLEQTDWSTTMVREVVPEEISALKAQPGGHLSLGGADLAATFQRLGLIDEYRVYVHPVLIGRGRPMFRPTDDRAPLRLVETHTFGNGVVLLRYQRADR
jgi:dihydrofolate reductase